MENDRIYFARRAAEEWDAVTAADCDPARIAHADLARRYVELASEPDNVVPLRRQGRSGSGDALHPQPLEAREHSGGS